MISNSRENILKHENPEYINSRPDWIVGKVPSLEDYRKISVDDMQEAFTLAKIGQTMASAFIPQVHGKPMQLYFTQALIVGAAVVTRDMCKEYGLNYEKYRSVLMVCPSRYGKGCPFDTPVLTPSGWRTHGELEIGDYVYHPSGKPIQVIGKSSTFECKYRVYFTNGEHIDTSAEHEWQVWDKTHRNYRVLETGKMLQRGLTYKEKDYTRHRYLIDPAKPCVFKEQSQPISPYFLGCWLGDGTSTQPVITLSSEKAVDILPYIGYALKTSYPQVGCRRYSFTRQGILENLRKLNLCGNKHIPAIYKYASFEQQKQLLAGIVDTDGYVDKAGRVTISCANEKLAQDIIELLTIMGNRPYETVVSAKTSSSGIVGKRDVHQIGFQPSYALPTHHKQLTRIVPHKRIAISKIEKLDKGKIGNCIQVDSPDGLYLVGKKLIPTHNSYLNAIALIIRAAGNGDECQVGGATKEKASIIQNKIVELLPGAAPDVISGLVVSKDESVDEALKRVQRLSTSVSKQSLKWQNGGSINLFSTNDTQKNSQVASAGAIGIGGDYEVLDELQLMTPVGFRTASRFMMESPDTKRFCVGNPMINGHFKELYDDPSTFVVHMNDVTAIIEQRMTRNGFALTGIPTYSNEYRYYIECEFPDEHSGTKFFPEMPQIWDPAKLPMPQRRTCFIGIDSAYGGGDSLMGSVLSLNEGGGKMWFSVEECVDFKRNVLEWNDSTTFEIAVEILKLWQRYHVVAGCIDIGFGIHLYEKLKELDPNLPLEAINYASGPTASRVENDYNAKYAYNMRAELHLDLRDICSSDNFYINGIDYDEAVKEMREISQAPEAQKIKIESKKDIKARLGRSPDLLDSICLAIHAMVLSGVLMPNSTDLDTDAIMDVIGGD